MKIVLGLGSNLGDRWTYLRAATAALRALPRLQLMGVSGVYETPPWGVKEGETPPAPYLNACVLLKADAGWSAEAMLGACLGIEAALGRERDASNQYAARCIDIDLLLASSGEALLTLNSAQLTLPHPRFALRAFALKPAIELWPHPQLLAWIASREVQADAASVRLLEGRL